MSKSNGFDNILNIGLIMYLYYISSSKAWYWAWTWLN